MGTDLWLQITMAYPPFVQYHQTFQQLCGDLIGVLHRIIIVILNIHAQIAILKILHGDINRILVFKPSQE